MCQLFDFQAISRSGFAWYEFQYGYDFNVSNCTGNSGCYTALIYATIITPTVSFGYLGLFLRIEPHAYEKFRELFCLRPRNRTESVEVYSPKGGAGTIATTTMKSTTTDNTAAVASSANALSAEEAPCEPNADKHRAQSAHTEESVSTNNAYIARESSIFQQLHQSSFAFAGSSLWNTGVEEADDRDEDALLSSINSEQLPGPPSFSFSRSIGGGGGSSFSNPAAGDIEEAPGRASFLKSALSRSMFSSKRKSVTLDLSLQSSTSSPMISMPGVRGTQELRDDAFMNSSL